MKALSLIKCQGCGKYSWLISSINLTHLNSVVSTVSTVSKVSAVSSACSQWPVSRRILDVPFSRYEAIRNMNGYLCGYFYISGPSIFLGEDANAECHWLVRRKPKNSRWIFIWRFFRRNYLSPTKKCLRKVFSTNEKMKIFLLSFCWIRFWLQKATWINTENFWIFLRHEFQLNL